MKTSPIAQVDVIRRLRCAAGHLNAVIDMAEAGSGCEDVLHQVRAVEAALHNASSCLLSWQIKQSEILILAEDSAAERAAELKRLVSLYSTLMRGPGRRPEANE